MRIAFYTETFLPKWDGVTAMLCRLLDYCHARGHATLLFAPRGAPLHYEQTPVIGVSDCAFPVHPDLERAAPCMDGERRLAEFRPDIVHLVDPGLVGLVGLRHARAVGAPIAVSYHNPLPRYVTRRGGEPGCDVLWPYFRWIHDRVDLLLCPSHSIRVDLERWGFHGVQVWGRGVDTEQFSRRWYSEPWRLRLSGGCPELPLLLWIGRMDSEKVIESLGQLMRLLPEVRLAVVGDGPLRAALERVCAERTRGNSRVTFVHCKSPDDLPHIYASADLLLAPTMDDVDEDQILSAMASETPVVAPRLSRAVDHIVSGLNGFLFEPGNLNDMAAMIRSLTSEPASLRRFGASARAHALSHAWDRTFDRLLGYYAAVLEERAGRRKFFTGRQTTWPGVAGHAAYR